MLVMAVARSSSDVSAMLYTSGFQDDVTFSHNGASGQNRLRYVSPSCQVAAPGAKSDVYDCLVAHRILLSLLTRNNCS